jgi:hypothetical protein
LESFNFLADGDFFCFAESSADVMTWGRSSSKQKSSLGLLRYLLRREEENPNLKLRVRRKRFPKSEDVNRRLSLLPPPERLLNQTMMLRRITR